MWRFCITRLQELRGPDVRERDLANILGFEHSLAVRWKEGMMYIDRAEYLLRLSEALAVDTMVLLDVVADKISAKEAHERVEREGRKEVKAAARREAAFKMLAEAPTGGRPSDAPLVLGILADRGPFRAAVEADPRLDGAATSNLLIGVAAAETWRPELVLLDWDLSCEHATEMCRVLSTLQLNPPPNRCKVVVAATKPAEVTLAARMASAAAVIALPIQGEELGDELGRVGGRG